MLVGRLLLCVVVLVLFISLTVATTCSFANGQQWTGHFPETDNPATNDLEHTYVEFSLTSVGGVLEKNEKFLRMGYWSFANGELQLYDVNTSPTTYSCPSNQVGFYLLSFTADCKQFKLSLDHDACESRSPLYDGLKLTLHSTCTAVTNSTNLFNSATTGAVSLLAVVGVLLAALIF